MVSPEARFCRFGRIAAPTFPLVAIGGLALAGGFGFLGRRYGLVADQVARMEVVLADGRIVIGSEDEQADLFWALRGGGALGFGVVTDLTLRTHRLQPLTLCNGRWALEEAPDLIAAWQHWAPDAPGGVNLEIGLLAPEFPEMPAFVELFGIVLGTPAEASPHLVRLRGQLGSLASGLRTWALGPAAAADFTVGLINHEAAPAWLPSRPYVGTGFHATRSHFFDRPIDRDAIAACVERLAADRRYGEHRELELIPWGGAYARDDGTACFAHRGARLLIRHSAFTGARADRALRAHAADWARASAATLAAAADGGAYQGYAEPERPGWAEACYRGALPRLAEIRESFDPGGLFAAASPVAAQPAARAAAAPR